jgi:hypothetical protein
VTSKTVTLITGRSGTGKTSLLATAAEWIFETYGRLSRLVTGDGGGFGSKMEGLIKVGMVQVWRVRTRAGAGGEGLVEETLARASSGWWPEYFQEGPDGPTGEVLPKTRLLSPIETTFQMSCPKGHLLKTTTDRRALHPVRCSQCGTAVDLKTAVITESQRLAPHMQGIGAYFFEGITSWSTWQLSSLADRRGRGDLHGEKSSIGGFKSGDMLFDANNRADYGYAQAAAERWLLASTAIPGLVAPPIWTGLETRVDESETVATHWGPAIAGQARTWQVPQWVGDYLGTAKITNPDTGKLEFRLYTSEYRGEDRLPHPYKVRCEPGLMPEFFGDSSAEPFSGFNLGLYLAKVQEAEKISEERALRKYGDKLRRVMAQILHGDLAQIQQPATPGPATPATQPAEPAGPATPAVEPAGEVKEELAAAAPARPALPRARSPVPVRRR